MIQNGRDGKVGECYESNVLISQIYDLDLQIRKPQEEVNKIQIGAALFVFVDN